MMNDEIDPQIPQKSENKDNELYQSLKNKSTVTNMPKTFALDMTTNTNNCSNNSYGQTDNDIGVYMSLKDGDELTKSLNVLKKSPLLRILDGTSQTALFLPHCLSMNDGLQHIENFNNERTLVVSQTESILISQTSSCSKSADGDVDFPNCDPNIICYEDTALPVGLYV